MSSVWFLLFCACVVGLASAIPKLRYNIDEADLHFEHFINKYNKQYADEHEKQSRFQIFKENLVKVNQLNERFNSSSHGITLFMDLSIEEFRKMHTGLKVAPSGCTLLTDADIPDAGAPDKFDWRENNGVTPMRNQKQCGSCYAFSAVGNIESQYLIKNKVSLDLAEQQVLDCDKRNGNCNGGEVSRVFRTFIEIGGVESEADYPYVNEMENCTFDVNKVKVKLADCFTYNLTSQEKLKQLLYHYGPISIAIKADGISTIEEDVIISDEECDVGSLNHAVLLVGYGERDGTPYWIIKNSWGTQWGQGGYFKVVRGEKASSCAMLNDSMAAAILA